MTYVLDTNLFIASLNGNHEVLSRLEALSAEDIVLCAPVLAELEYGACVSTRKEGGSRRRTISAGQFPNPAGD